MKLNSNSVLVQEEFSRDIEEIVYMYDVCYMDAIIIYAERVGAEVETVGALVKRHPVLKAKLHEECAEVNLVERTPKLDLG